MLQLPGPCNQWCYEATGRCRWKYTTLSLLHIKHDIHELAQLEELKSTSCILHVMSPHNSLDRVLLNKKRGMEELCICVL